MPNFSEKIKGRSQRENNNNTNKNWQKQKDMLIFQKMLRS